MPSSATAMALSRSASLRTPSRLGTQPQTKERPHSDSPKNESVIGLSYRAGVWMKRIRSRDGMLSSKNFKARGSAICQSIGRPLAAPT